ncbi:hypothetical protein LB557_06470 [Mesorhizobium sp. BR115XR7A]|uniref:hypothetical protein n=1 Tax=Mesorhizobium sp. BR115XR7A TaxID=2876645 RepID=UPI001CCF3F1B|nr:hypothetical protein [Mesorhizobium sp. BR115XR7A]MBZ9905640.1 hypothetical protein [Mesorhizobium sp. BR115XR7A]MBZ9931734.1 hypothetical protein [Mesorhizobium sp. BR1-1-5]
MRNLMLVFAALALAACQSPQEVRQSVAVEPASSPAVLPAATMVQSPTITPPGKDVPAKYAAFSGSWVGRLESTSEGRLDVQSVSSNGKVTVNYAWGVLDDNNPGEAAGTGKIVGNALRLGRLPNGADASFQMLPDGTLAETFALAGKTYTGVLTKQ